MLKKIIRRLRQSILVDFLRSLIPDKLVNSLFHFPSALLAVLYYRYPAKSLKVIGVTGTDGKTTTSSLIYSILKQANYKVALISTVSAKIGENELATGLHVTSPSPWELQRLLRLIVDKGFKYVVLESTSHGLAQHRLLGCNFFMGVVTNITHEHLDYHKTWNNYLSSKAKLFKQTKYNILNKDDKSFKILKKLIGKNIITYGLNQADYSVKKTIFKTQLIGEFNILNCLAAYAVADLLKVNKITIQKAIADFKGVIGRMEEIKMGQNFKVFVDFAHTPNGLKNALQALKQLPHHKLIAVFGCAGLRDPSKRPMMGKIACQLANKVVLTAEDPRTEKVDDIISQIINGCDNKNKIYNNGGSEIFK